MACCLEEKKIDKSFNNILYNFVRFRDHVSGFMDQMTHQNVKNFHIKNILRLKGTLIQI